MKKWQDNLMMRKMAPIDDEEMEGQAQEEEEDF